ncbi:hypothetical protein MMC12_003083 [Toensbergia leucococca]|nr:hypothetical protein [Toensbergia leucococca]
MAAHDDDPIKLSTLLFRPPIARALSSYLKPADLASLTVLSKLCNEYIQPSFKEYRRAAAQNVACPKCQKELWTCDGAQVTPISPQASPLSEKPRKILLEPHDVHLSSKCEAESKFAKPSSGKLSMTSSQTPQGHGPSPDHDALNPGTLILLDAFYASVLLAMTKVVL